MIDRNGLGKLWRGRGGVGILLIEDIIKGVDKIDVILLIVLQPGLKNLTLWRPLPPLPMSVLLELTVGSQTNIPIFKNVDSWIIFLGAKW